MYLKVRCRFLAVIMFIHNLQKQWLENNPRPNQLNYWHLVLSTSKFLKRTTFQWKISYSHKILEVTRKSIWWALTRRAAKMKIKRKKLLSQLQKSTLAMWTVFLNFTYLFYDDHNHLDDDCCQEYGKYSDPRYQQTANILEKWHQKSEECSVVVVFYKLCKLILLIIKLYSFFVEHDVFMLKCWTFWSDNSHIS